MTPSDFLNDKGIKYFREIEKILEDRGINNNAYNIELSVLCSEYAKYDQAMNDGAKDGFYNKFENGMIQVNAIHTVARDALAGINRLSGKFGLTPKDFDSIKSNIKEKKEKPKFKE